MFHVSCNHLLNWNYIWSVRRFSQAAAFGRGWCIWTSLPSGAAQLKITINEIAVPSTTKGWSLWKLPGSLIPSTNRMVGTMPSLKRRSYLIPQEDSLYYEDKTMNQICWSLWAVLNEKRLNMNVSASGSKFSPLSPTELHLFLFQERTTVV